MAQQQPVSQHGYPFAQQFFTHDPNAQFFMQQAWHVPPNRVAGQGSDSEYSSDSSSASYDPKVVLTKAKVKPQPPAVATNTAAAHDDTAGKAAAENAVEAAGKAAAENTVEAAGKAAAETTAGATGEAAAKTDAAGSAQASAGGSVQGASGPAQASAVPSPSSPSPSSSNSTDIELKRKKAADAALDRVQKMKREAADAAAQAAADEVAAKEAAAAARIANRKTALEYLRTTANADTILEDAEMLAVVSKFVGTASEAMTQQSPAESKPSPEEGTSKWENDSEFSFAVVPSESSRP